MIHCQQVAEIENANAVLLPQSEIKGAFERYRVCDVREFAVDDGNVLSAWAGVVRPLSVCAEWRKKYDAEYDRFHFYCPLIAT